MTDTPNGDHENIDLIREPGYVEFDTISNGERKVIRAQAGYFANGCAWRQHFVQNEDERPCYMYCQWPELSSAVSKKRGAPVTEEEFIAQTASFVEKINQKNEELAASDNERGVERVDMYIAGSQLNAAEMPFDLLEEQYRQIAAIKSVREIVIEARITDLDDIKLAALNRIAGETNTKCIISVGVETTNEIILADAKKGITKQSIQKGLERIAEYSHLAPQAYLLLKPAVMAERSAINQAVNDIEFIANIMRERKQNSRKRISINMAPVAPISGTGAALNDAYKPTSLWSVVEIIEKLRQTDSLNYITLYFGLNTETADVEKEITSCESCKDDVIAIIQQFNATQDPNCVTRLPECDCKKEWSEKKEEEGFPIGRVHYPYDPNNPAAKTLFERQLAGIVDVELGSTYTEESKVTEDIIRQRIETAGGHLQVVAYDPDTGEIIGYWLSALMDRNVFNQIPEDKRGFDNLKMVPHDPKGQILRAISFAAKPEAPPGVGKALTNQGVFAIIDDFGLDGLIGAMRLCGLRAIKEKLEKKMEAEEPLTEEEIFSIAQQYVDAHFVRLNYDRQHGQIDRSPMQISFKIRNRTIEMSCPLDQDVTLWGRKEHIQFGSVVYSMKDDPESCHLGLYAFYPGKNANLVRSDTAQAIYSVIPNVRKT